jgi:hypothetical protein
MKKPAKKASKQEKFKSQIYQHHYLQGHYLEVPKKIVQAFGGTFNIRLLCTLNKSLTFQCGFMALGEGRALITINKARMKALHVFAGDKVDVELRLDGSKFGMEMSEELQEVLNQDEEGLRRFEGLTPGMQRNVIRWVGSVKNPDKLIERSLFMIGNLKGLPQGKVTMRGLLGLPARYK